MRAHRHDPPLIEHHDPVRPFHRRQPVRHHQRRAPLCQPVHRRLHQPFAFRVQRTRRLVQKQHRRIPQDRPRNRDPLLLPPREHHAPLPHIAVIAIRQRRQKIMRRRRLRRRLHLAVTGPRSPEPDVFPRARRKDHRVLRHQGHRPPEIPPRQIPQVDPVNRDPPPLRIIEPQQQLQDRRLPRP